MVHRARTFLVECYLPGADPAEVAVTGDRVRRAAQELLAQGREIAYLGATLVVADEVVFHAFRASDAHVIGEATRTGGLAFERVVESIGIGGDPIPLGAGGIEVREVSG